MATKVKIGNKTLLLTEEEYSESNNNVEFIKEYGRCDGGCHRACVFHSESLYTIKDDIPTSLHCMRLVEYVLKKDRLMLNVKVDYPAVWDIVKKQYEASRFDTCDIEA